MAQEPGSEGMTTRAAPRLSGRAFRLAARALRFSGRASRRDYWLFLPFGLALSALSGGTTLWLTGHVWLAVIAALFGLLPQIAITTRRQRDAGGPVGLVQDGSVQLVSFLALLWLLTSSWTWFQTQFAHADGPGGFGLMVLFWLIIPPLFLASLGRLIAGACLGAALFSAMAEPSAPFSAPTGASRFPS